MRSSARSRANLMAAVLVGSGPSSSRPAADLASARHGLGGQRPRPSRRLAAAVGRDGNDIERSVHWFGAESADGLMALQDETADISSDGHARGVRRAL